jgi:nucleoside diphosphate kinase
MDKKLYIHLRRMNSSSDVASGDTDVDERSDYADDTFVMLKPDCLERDLMNETLEYIRQHNVQTTEYADSPLRIAAMTTMQMTDDLLNAHYSNVDPAIRDEELHPYFGTDDGDGYDVIPMIVAGEEAVKRVREIVVDPIDPDEDTFLPQNSEPGTIRGDLVQEETAIYADPAEWPHYYQGFTLGDKDTPIYNLVHAAEDETDAKNEIELFFGQFMDEKTDDATVEAFFGDTPSVNSFEQMEYGLGQN